MDLRPTQKPRTNCESIALKPACSRYANGNMKYSKLCESLACRQRNAAQTTRSLDTRTASAFETSVFVILVLNAHKPCMGVTTYASCRSGQSCQHRFYADLCQPGHAHDPRAGLLLRWSRPAQERPDDHDTKLRLAWMDDGRMVRVWLFRKFW